MELIKQIYEIKDYVDGKYLINLKNELMKLDENTLKIYQFSLKEKYNALEELINNKESRLRNQINITKKKIKYNIFHKNKLKSKLKLLDYNLHKLQKEDIYIKKYNIIQVNELLEIVLTWKINQYQV